MVEIKKIIFPSLLFGSEWAILLSDVWAMLTAALPATTTSTLYPAHGAAISCNYINMLKSFNEK